jgi:hypothetical protein
LSRLSAGKLKENSECPDPVTRSIGFLGFNSGGFSEYATAERRSLVQLLFNKQPTREGETL